MRLRSLAARVALALCLPIPLAAQQPAGGSAVAGPDSAAAAGRDTAATLAPAMPGAASAATAPRAARRIVRIDIDRRGVFDEGSPIPLVAKVGEALHIRTRRRVVERELLVRAGQPFDSARVAETARNLRALFVFRRVLIDTVTAEPADSGVVLRIVTQDGWSTTPTLEFASTGQQTSITAGIAELNFLGWAAFASLLVTDSPDRTSITATYRQPRLFASRVNFGASYQWRTDGRFVSAGLAQPFFSLSSRFAAGLSGLDFDGDVLRFREGVLTPAELLRRRYALVRAEAARALVASPEGYLRVGVAGQLRRDDFVARPALGQVPFPSSVTGTVGAFVSWSRAQYLVAYNYRSFYREEDIDLSPFVRVGLNAAPSLFGYARGGVGLDLVARGAIPFRGGFVRAGLAVDGVLAGSTIDSGTVRLSTTALLQPDRRHTFVVHAQAGWQRNQVPGEEFDLGLGFGLRAYPLHAFTGDRMWFTMAEYRFTAVENWLNTIGLGLAAFAERGGAWYAGNARRLGTSVGVGLRLGPSRLSNGDYVRVDLARRFADDRRPAGWVLVVGRGFTF